MNPISRFFHWIGKGRAAGRLRRQARRAAEPADRVALLERAVALDDSASTWMELAVAAARCGRLGQAAESWRRAIAMQPVLIPPDAEMAALAPVLPLVAGDLLAAVSGGRRAFGDRRWKLERRGAFDGEERWKVEQERASEMKELLPALRFVAQAISHTAGAPGRVRFDCDRLERDSDAYNEIVQMGEVLIRWDESRRITGVDVRE
ncbi:hypothetical protein [Longimicrobium sp.]|uniref:hypothetical protein n=1 Tax=Longimicrobium sp. TaxID=2029185 RepID=UPI002C1F1DB8|nr:hypothetical protein [Longimicrobium sp.]HSU17231.1 hypothetical protein [Longimicrobium sp.]